MPDLLSLPSGTVTFLFTDIEGSTRLWDECPDEMRAGLERHDEILLSVFEARGGYVFSTGGDGFGVAFTRAGDAVEAAIDAQGRLGGERWSERARLLVRMGLHTGEVQERDGDYFGPAVNVAARVMSVAHGGQTLVSDATRQLVADAGLMDLGVHRLRGMSEHVRVWQVGSGEFGGLRVGGEAGNLPSPASSFLGRRSEIERLQAVLGGGKTVTLLGVGGVGKTRFAIETAAGLSDEFADGVWFCELAPVGDPALVIDAVASVLAVRPQPAMSMLDSIVDSLRGRRMLVVLDNCEHVLEPAAAIAGSLNAGAPTVALLATSREPLGVPGEQVWPVPSLDAAVELFLVRAGEADGSFDPTGVDREHVARLCVRLDGLPLAIELAAARVRSMTITDISGRLEDRFRLLRGSGRGGVERHQTLAATVQWSYDLLEEAERVLFDQLCAYAGSFDISAIERVCIDGGAVDPYDLVDLMASMVDKSMVVADRSGPTVRYRLLETFRQFGETHLNHDQLVGLKERHLDHYLDRACVAQELLSSPRYQEAYQFFTDEWDNIRAGMGWALAIEDHARSAQLLLPAHNWAVWNLLTETGDWARQLLALGDTSPVAYATSSFFYAIAGDYEEELRVGREGLEKANWEVSAETTWMWGPYSAALRIIGDREEAEAATRSAYAAAHRPEDQAYVAAILALFISRHQPDAAAEWALECQALLDSGIPPHTAVPTLTFLSLHYALSGDLNTAADKGRQALELAHTHEMAWGTVQATTNLAHLASRGAGPDPAGAFRQAIITAHTHRCWFDLWPCLRRLAHWWTDTGQHQAAAVLAGYLTANNHAPRTQPHPDQADNQPEPDQQWLDLGANLDRDQLIDYVLDHLS
ncbi:MAG: adenylate/guanylate cyclase domain-containing protein [bacterium]|nr:adenylate/guanylate cyclase domain-containing protein [bacterium]